MTGKRFVKYVDEWGYWYIKDTETGRCAKWDSYAYEWLNALHEENQELRKALKKEYMVMSGCLCDACKYEEAIYTNNWFIGEDYDVKCNKGHEILADDEKQECNDFELRLEELE